MEVPLLRLASLDLAGSTDWKSRELACLQQRSLPEYQCSIAILHVPA